jgi:hypothetical protein
VWLSLNPPSFDTGQFRTPQEIVEAVNLFDQPLSLVDSTLTQIQQSQR